MSDIFNFSILKIGEYEIKIETVLLLLLLCTIVVILLYLIKRTIYRAPKIDEAKK